MPLVPVGRSSLSVLRCVLFRSAVLVDILLLVTPPHTHTKQDRSTRQASGTTTLRRPACLSGPCVGTPTVSPPHRPTTGGPLSTVVVPSCASHVRRRSTHPRSDELRKCVARWPVSLAGCVSSRLLLVFQSVVQQPAVCRCMCLCLSHVVLRKKRSGQLLGLHSRAIGVDAMLSSTRLCAHLSCPVCV